MSLPYYHRFPDKLLDATFGWSFELKGAYGLVLDLIYARDGKLADDAQGIAGALGLSVRKWNQLKSQLIELGKLRVVDGILRNSRADDLLIIRRTYQDNQAKKRSRPNKNKGEGYPGSTLLVTLPTEEVKREPIGSLIKKEKLDTAKRQAASSGELFASREFRERCKAAAGECLSPKVKAFASIAALITPERGEDRIIAIIADVADGKDAGSVTSWNYFASAIKNYRDKPAKASAPGREEPMSREDGKIESFWISVRHPETGEVLAKQHRKTGDIRDTHFKPFDGGVPSEIIAFLPIPLPAEVA